MAFKSQFYTYITNNFEKQCKNRKIAEFCKLIGYLNSAQGLTECNIPDTKSEKHSKKVCSYVLRFINLRCKYPSFKIIQLNNVYIGLCYDCSSFKILISKFHDRKAMSFILYVVV